VLGWDHPHTLDALTSVAYWREAAGDAAGAAVAYGQLLAGLLRVLGPDDPATLEARANLVYWRGKAGNAAGAAIAFERLLADFLRVLGPDDPATLDARANLAYWRVKAGDVAGAEAAFQESLAEYMRVLGPDHRQTLSVRNILAHWHGTVGYVAGAASASQAQLMGIVTSLLLTVEVDGGDAEEIDDLTRGLLVEIEHGSGVGLAHAPARKGQLPVLTVPAAVPGLVAVVRSWLVRLRDQRVKVTLTLNHRSMSVEYPIGSMTHAQLTELLGRVREGPE
jgi:hypothetical protein